MAQDRHLSFSVYICQLAAHSFSKANFKSPTYLKKSPPAFPIHPIKTIHNAFLKQLNSLITKPTPLNQKGKEQKKWSTPLSCTSAPNPTRIASASYASSSSKPPGSRRKTPRLSPGSSCGTPRTSPGSPSWNAMSGRAYVHPLPTSSQVPTFQIPLSS